MQTPIPRRPRLGLPNITQHIIQRGNDRQPCFFADVDRLRYLDDWREICTKEECAVHAYVLMTKHVHLLATPSSGGQIGRIMQALGRRHVRFVNDRCRRTDTLWEGRYKSCLVDSETCLLRCYRYIELNPVRAGMLALPSDCRWPSHAANAAGHHDPLVREHPAYQALGATASEPQLAYRGLFDAPATADEVDTIRLARPIGPATVGRPRKPRQGTETAL